ncbi:MAG: DUF2911 domain-containing protein [Chitinophagaceae bacterium]|nr:DUF2911 domain-containing protein [Chitinophagaceae bacterium]MCW5926549.1 DUF2911 domain-containing protein [Chitinophagaceae bacterium]
MKYYLLLLLIVSFACRQRTGLTDAKVKLQEAHAQHKLDEDKEAYIRAVEEGKIAEDTLKGSPMRIAMGDVGKSHLHIAYSSPGVKDRVIWGGLVSYDKAWVTGAHKATCIIFTEPILFGGQPVPAGAYALFTIPREKEKWTVILNKNYDQHLADDYDEKEDILRIETIALENERVVRRLRYTVTNESKDKAALIIEWEKKKLSVSLEAP